MKLFWMGVAWGVLAAFLGGMAFSKGEWGWWAACIISATWLMGEARKVAEGDKEDKCDQPSP